MRSVGCGLLLLALCIAPAAGQAPDPVPLPAPDQAGNAARCDGTRWEKTIAEIKAADPEREAAAQIAQGNHALRSATVLIETFVEHQSLNLSRDAVLRDRLPGVQCHLDMQPNYMEAFPIQADATDAATGIDKRCVRAALELAEQYAKRFNERVVGDPAYPHRDRCSVGPGSDVSAKDTTVRFGTLPRSDQPADVVPVPTLDEARNAARCQDTPWAEPVAAAMASDPEGDAEKQIAEGHFTLRSARTLTISGRARALITAARVLVPIELGGVGLSVEGQPAGAHCLLDGRPTEAFSLPAYLESANTDDLVKWCARAAVVLTQDYARRFNARVLRDQGYPHKDVCAAVPADAGDGQTAAPARRIADQPAADLIPAVIPDIVTAARFGLADRVERFIADGADIGQRDVFDFDALQWAVVRNYRPLFDLLNAASGGPDAILPSRDKPDFCRALGAAVTHGRVELAAPIARRCAAHERRLKLLEPAIAGGSLQIVEALLDAEPALSLVDVGQTLPADVLASRIDILRLVLDRAAAAPEGSGALWERAMRSILATALEARKLDVAELLLDRGFKVGPDTLRLAVERRSRELVQVLARHGADLNAARPYPTPSVTLTSLSPDPVGRPPLLSVSPRLAREADPAIFLVLRPRLDLDMLNLLLQVGADPNVRDGSGRAPLIVAITEAQIYGRKDGIGWIEPYVPQRLIEGQEDWAHRGIEPVLALLAKGADVRLTDKDGLTALHHAARSDYAVEIAQILLEHGADINARDASGRTPLDHARAAKLVRMPDVLVTAGARSGLQ